MDCVYSYYQVLYNQNAMICKRCTWKLSASCAVNKRICGIYLADKTGFVSRLSTLFQGGRQANSRIKHIRSVLLHDLRVKNVSLQGSFNVFMSKALHDRFGRRSLFGQHCPVSVSQTMAVEQRKPHRIVDNPRAILEGFRRQDNPVLPDGYRHDLLTGNGRVSWRL